MNHSHLFKDKNILITATSCRTGNAITEYILKQGGTVLAIYNTNKKEPKELIKKYSDQQISFLQCDVTSESAVTTLYQTVNQQIDHLDGLINIVGDYQEGKINYTSFSDWNHMMNSNLHSVFLMCKTFYPLLKKANFSRIINFGFTNASKLSASRCPGYHIAKTGVLILSKTLANEWGKDQISVNVISPGTLSNSIIKQSQDPSDYIPQGRYGEYEDLFPVLDMIFRKDSTYISGNNFKVSGAYNV